MKLNQVLLIDDDDIANHLNFKAIENMGFARHIVVKKDGKEALIYLKEECPVTNKYPELLLLDLKMPGMDGFQFLQEFEVLSKDFREEIVVVILTGSRNADDIIRLRKLGRYYLISKPLTSDKLEDIYHRFFRRKSIFK